MGIDTTNYHLLTNDALVQFGVAFVENPDCKEGLPIKMQTTVLNRLEIATATITELQRERDALMSDAAFGRAVIEFLRDRGYDV